MPIPHSSVNYIEPNLSSTKYEFSGNNFQQWALNDDFERAPRLEDYSIMLNLEVEVCSRKNISKNETITKDVLILSYTTNQIDGRSVVNFMGGTKVECHDSNESFINYLTTNYADMYVGDLIHYGTTEMIGIKSVDIEYQKSCVPIINIKFTDVRGLSLFQPTELSRTNAYQGIGGINADNVAQSFFQCFFKVPMPKFTITIKGFYGKPVTYEVLCDKFETSFNSDTGDFDIDTRFIGYSYSFLTDIVMDALVAAPYSDYGGTNGEYNKYWSQEIESNRFVIWNKEHTIQEKMPTLYEIFNTVDYALKNAKGVNTVITEEERTHASEIEKLQSIRELYSLWYSTLYNICCERYGKEYCYLFKDGSCEYRLLILANDKTKDDIDLYDVYEKMPDSFKEINQNLNAAIDEYNNGNYAFKKLNNVGDFIKYRRRLLFKPLFVNQNNEIVFNGFDERCNLPQTDIFSKVFNGVTYTGESANENAEQHRKYVLGTIYNDGVSQYIDCYSIDEDYRFIDDRIKALQADANKNPQEKEHEKRLKEINKEVLNLLGWYPSVENFTKIMMAHLETLMSQMYLCVSNCEGRVASELGVNPSLNLDTQNQNNQKDPEIPPFPRVYRAITGDDNITKNEDTWVGEFNGEKLFEEINLINGLFNGAEYVKAKYKDEIEKRAEEAKASQSESSTQTVVKHPLSSFDFYANKSIYGLSSELSQDDMGYELAGRIAIRMFDILSINNFRREFGSNFYGLKDTETVGKIEADNFYDSFKLKNSKLIEMIKNDVYSADTVLNYVTSGDSKCPWGEKPLFANDNNNVWLNGYETEDKSVTMFPIQNISFEKLKEAYSVLSQKDKITNCDGDVALSTIPTAVKEQNSDNYGYGSTLILDDINVIEEQLNNANTSADSGYTDIYNTICSASTFDGVNEYATFTIIKGSNSIIKKVESSESAKLSAVIKNYVPYLTVEEVIQTNVQESTNTMILLGKEVQSVRSYDSVKTNETPLTNDGVSETFANESKNGDFNTLTIGEIFGIMAKEKKGNEKNKGYKDYFIDRTSSMVKTFKLSNLTGIGVKPYSLTENDAKLTTALFGILLNNGAIGNYLNKGTTVTYLPKLAVLQIGAIIYVTGGIHGAKDFKESTLRLLAQRFLPVGDKNTYSDGLFKYITTLSKTAKHQYEKYYMDWLSKNASRFASLFDENSDCYIKTYQENGKNLSNRRILNQNNEVVKELTAELFKAVCVVRLCVYHFNDVQPSNYALPRSTAQTYLKGFLGRLKELYGGNSEMNENGNVIQTTNSPTKTTTDMKKELYRYLKQIYDKWIPMSSFREWQLESFFNKGDGEEIGHKFYFIDSYYNDISSKLLINPKILADKIEGLLSSGDINVMLLGFMADMYSANRTMLMAIQNFADLRNPKAMDEMFTPLPYNSINWSRVNKYTSFVVVYPYQPSKNLDIPNGEYMNDGFMLNDEFETPMAIKSKVNEEDGHYRIPAFGVSYGKQYQSYFKKVNIDMKSPIATEQSIRAKHAILLGATSSGEKGVKSQDLYDVYASQSYTCSVEMMGCAWVQPLMYFVLLNVPMFRGSYMIMSVKHSIKPGNMITTFKGCRMASVSNTIIEDIFTDGNISNTNGEYTSFESEEQLKADVDNNCSYKIYPINKNGNIKLSGDETRDGLSIMSKLIGLGYNEWAAAGIVGNMYKESWDYKDTKLRFKFDLVVEDNSTKNKGTSGGLCMWRNGNLEDLVTKKAENLGHNKKVIIYSDEVKKKYSNGLNSIGLDYQLEYLKMTMTPGSGNYVPYSFDTYNSDSLSAKSPRSSAFNFQKKYELPKNTDSDRGDAAEAFYKAYKNGEKSVEDSKATNTEKKEDFIEAFFQAVNMSAKNTPSIGVELNKEMKGEYLRISQKNNETDKLDKVFDLILNSEYYDYVQNLGWIYPNGGMQTKVPPNAIFCFVAQNPNRNSKRVWACQVGETTGVNQKSEIPVGEGQSNPLILKPLAKRRAKVGNDANFKKEVQQLTDLSGLDIYKPKDCSTITYGSSGSGSLDGYNGNIKEGSDLYKLLDVANNGKALDYMDSATLGKNYKLMDAKVYGEKAYKGCCTSGPTTWYKRIGIDLTWWSDKGVTTSEHVTTRKWFDKNGFNLVWHGHLSQAENLSTSSFCPGDVATFHVYNRSGKATSHGVMWTGKDWRSDCIQRALSCYPGGRDRDGEYSVCIWRNPKLVSDGLGIHNTPNLA